MELQKRGRDAKNGRRKSDKQQEYAEKTNPLKAVGASFSRKWFIIWSFVIAAVVAIIAFGDLLPWPFRCGAKCKRSTKLWNARAHKDANLAGMISHLPELHGVDIRDSKRFIDGLISEKRLQSRNRALDCGAGIGRVSKELLMSYFDKVDAVDATKKFTKAYTNYVGRARQDRIGNIFWSPLEIVDRLQHRKTGLQRRLTWIKFVRTNLQDPSTDLNRIIPPSRLDFTPAASTYDLIWCQWVLMYLHDDELLKFLIRAKAALKPNGVFILKENSAGDFIDIPDEAEDGVTRSMNSLKKITENAGFRIVKSELQEDFPDNLFDVVMLALMPN